ncbi:MAG TPA: amidase [Gemmatimonadaceae bacterium]|nr:amidase [Gemmatimonadaceae bacterium]
MTPPIDPVRMTVAAAVMGLRDGSVTSVALVEACLAAIDAHGARTNAFIRVDGDAARRAALGADDELSRGIDRGALHGIPITIKDLIDIRGQPTTAASNVRRSHVADRDAPLVQSLREAGAIFLGKTNLHEFALGTTSEESAFGPVRNPHDPARSAGGSSGGSAAAVATGMGLASIGTDTGGSIRIPSAACATVGLKPTYGEVALDGVVPLAVSFDHAGPITKSVQDARVLWTVLAGRELAPSAPIPAGTIKLGALGGYFTELLDAHVRRAFEDAMARLQQAGVTIQSRVIDEAALIVDTYVNISLPEAAHWHAPTIDERAADYQPPVRARLDRGRQISAVDYLRARDTRLRLMRSVDAALADCHALVLPTLPIAAPLQGANDVTFDNGETLLVRAAMLRLTQLFNMTGHPALSLPIHVTGLPAGLQLVGRRDATEDLLAVAQACEQLI